MQPPVAGSTGNAPPPVRPPGSTGGAGTSLDKALVAGLSGLGALCCDAATAPNPTITANRPALARSAMADLLLFVMPTNYRRQMSDVLEPSGTGRGRSQPPGPGPGAGAGGASCGWPSAGAGWWCGIVPGQVIPRMHPQLSPIMQAPPPTGTTGKAPSPPVGPPGSVGGAGASPDRVLGAAIAGVGSTPPTAVPHPTNKTNRPALARRAIVLLPSFVIALAATAGARARARWSTAWIAIRGSGIVVRDGPRAGDATNAPTVEADDAAARLRQRGKLGGNHRQGAAAGNTATITWGQRCFAGYSARHRHIRWRIALLRTDCRTASDYQDKRGHGTAQCDSRPAFVHHSSQLYVFHVTSA